MGRERGGRGRGRLLRGRNQIRERDQGEGARAWGGQGARAWGGQGAPWARGPSWAGPGWARPSLVTPRVKTHDTHDHQSKSDREPKSETGRDEHATNHDIRQRNMLQHDATPMTLMFCLHMTQTPVTILL